MSQDLSNGFNLGAFLAEQRAEGTEESSGEFTVSSKKALQKLAQFSLSTEYAWLLKLIQAVVLWDCPELRVTQNRISTTFFFCPARDFPEERAVVKRLRDGGAQKHDPLDQLCIALRSLVEQAGLAFVLSIHADQPSQHPIYSGEDVAKLSQQERMKWARVEERGVGLAISHFRGEESVTGRHLPTFTQVERRDMKIAEELAYAVPFCPVPVVMDGRILNCLVSHPDFGFNQRSRPVVLSGLPDDQFPRLPVPPTYEEKRISLFTTPSRAARTYEGQRDFTVWYCISARSPANMGLKTLNRKRPKNEILWIQNGVVVERSDASSPTDICSLRVLVSGAGYATDISGLSLTQSVEREQLQSQILDRVFKDIGERFSRPDFLDGDDRDELSGRESDEPVDQKEHSFLRHNVLPSVGLGLMSLVAIPTLGPVWLVPSLVSGLSVAAGVAAQKYRDSDYHQAKRQREWLSVVPKDLQILARLKSESFRPVETAGVSGRLQRELFKPRNS